ncbi:MAG: hypothetical protein COZ65_02125 [Caldiserica bacterium CG_4_8_14_3_um_filter_35_18]|nr:MAG: hypothetical protein COZ65_02125 [Caldiserica bacterium CG_4_8_14_3_um_filter_35_18]
MFKQTIVYSNEIEDRLLVPFYIAKQLVKKYNLTLGDIAKQITNGIDLRNFIKEGTLYFRISDIKRGQMNFLTAKKVKEKINEVPKKILIRRGDLLMSRKGTPGVTTLATELEEQSIIGTEIIKITIKEDSKILPEFLFAFLNHKFGFNQVLSKLTGTVSRGINHPALKSIRVPEADYSKQKLIADKVKRVFEKHVLAISKIEEAKKLFEEALDINYNEIDEEKIYNVSSTDLSDILTPKFYYPKYLNTLKALKKKFRTIKLGDISDIQRGEEVGSKNYHTFSIKSDSDIPFIRTSDLVNYEIDDYPDYYIDEETYKDLEQDLRVGDIVYTKDGKIGLSAILTNEDKCILASGLARIRITKIFNPYYAFLVLSTNIGYYQVSQRIVIAATLPHLQQDRLAEIEIPIINNQVQKEISELVAEAFRLKTEKKKLFREALTKIEELLK